MLTSFPVHIFVHGLSGWNYVVTVLSKDINLHSVLMGIFFRLCLLVFVYVGHLH